VHWSFSIPLFLLIGLPGLILMVRLHAIGFIWLFQVPVRRKLPIYFLSWWPALLWFLGFAVCGFAADRLEPFIGDAFAGVLGLVPFGLFYVGLFMHGKRWVDRMLKEGWMGTLGSKREKIWTIAVSAGVALIIMRELLSMNS
jgi:hypothetical protein